LTTDAENLHMGVFDGAESESELRFGNLKFEFAPKCKNSLFRDFIRGS